MLIGSVFSLSVTAALAVACGDDDNASAPITTADAAAAVDGSAASPDADASTLPDGSVARSITPTTVTRLPNTWTPYGLLYGSDGLLYVSGATVTDVQKLAVWRFKDGALDTTFGSAGVVTVDVPGNEQSYGIVETSPGTFAVHAFAAGKVWLTKLSKDSGGAYAFGTPVFVKFGYDDGEGWPVGTPNAPTTLPLLNASWGIALDKSNAAQPKIVVFASGAPAKTANVADQRIDNDRWITRVLANDTFAFDDTFNSDGTHGAPYSTDIDSLKGSDNARRGIVLADGSIVSAGYTDYGGTERHHVCLIRLLPTGKPDPAFGFGTSPALPGQAKFNPYKGKGGNAESYAVVRQASGRLVTTGYGNSHTTLQSKDLDLVSFGVGPEGLDTTYGTTGMLSWQSEGRAFGGLGNNGFQDRSRDIAILPGERLVHAGLYDSYAAIFVTDKDGKPDLTVGTEGRIVFEYPAAFFSLAVSPDGKQIAATTQALNQTTDAAAPLGAVLATFKIEQ